MDLNSQPEVSQLEVSQSERSWWRRSLSRLPPALRSRLLELPRPVPQTEGEERRQSRQHAHRRNRKKGSSPNLEFTNAEELRKLWDSVVDGSVELEGEGAWKHARDVPENERLKWTVDQVVAFTKNTIGRSRDEKEFESGRNVDVHDDIVYVFHTTSVKMSDFVEVVERDLSPCSLVVQILQHKQRMSIPQSNAHVVLVLNSFHDFEPFEDPGTIRALESLFKEKPSFQWDLLYGLTSIESELHAGNLEKLKESLASLCKHSKERLLSQYQRDSKKKEVYLNAWEKVLPQMVSIWKVHVEKAFEAARDEEIIDRVKFGNFLVDAGLLLGELNDLHKEYEFDNLDEDQDYNEYDSDDEEYDQAFPSYGDEIDTSTKEEEYIIRGLSVLRPRSSPSLEDINPLRKIAAYYRKKYSRKSRVFYLEALRLSETFANGEGSTQLDGLALRKEATQAAAESWDMQDYYTIARETYNHYYEKQGAEDLDTLRAHHESARASMVMAKENEALDILWSTSGLVEKNFPGENLFLGEIFADIAETYRALADYTQAQSTLDLAMDFYEAAHTSNNSNFEVLLGKAKAMVTLSRIMREKGMFNQATEMAKVALAKHEEILNNPKDYRLAFPLTFYAECHFRNFEFEEGLSLLQRAIDNVLRRVKVQHYWNIELQACRARALGHAEVGRNWESSIGLDSCKSWQKIRNVPEDHPWRGVLLANLGKLNRDADELRTGIAILEKHFGKNHFRLAGYLYDLGKLPLSPASLGREINMQVIDIIDTTFPDQLHYLRALAITELGLRYKEEGELDKALVLLQEAQDMIVTIYSPQHPNVRNIRFIIRSIEH